jgi:outer membrane protein assembly factor BamC
MRILRVTAMGLSLLILAGCGSVSVDEKRVDYKAATVSVPPLEIPPDLTTPTAEDRYTVPGSDTASYSDYVKGTVAAQPKVLPQAKNVHVEHEGEQRWLVVEDKAENVWPEVKAFWQSKGFVIKTEDPQAGVMETDWLENRANIPESGIRRLLGKVFEGMYDSGTRDRFRTRLERSKDGNSTEIYITHYGMEEMLSADKTTSKWQPRPRDPELENTMLQMLMARLVGDKDAEAKAAQQAAAAPAAEASAPPRLQDSASGGKIIVLAEPFDRGWREVGLALDKAGLTVDDKDRAGGVYYLRVAAPQQEKGLLDKLAFWRKDEKKMLRYQVMVRQTDTGSEVSAKAGEGENGQETERIINLLYQNLGK